MALAGDGPPSWAVYLSKLASSMPACPWLWQVMALTESHRGRSASLKAAVTCACNLCSPNASGVRFCLTAVLQGT